MYGILCFGAVGLKVRHPSIRLLLDHGIIWVNPTRPWPSGTDKHVRNEDSGESARFIIIFLEGQLFPNDGFIGDARLLPGDKDRNATEGAKDEQADEWTEKENKRFHAEYQICSITR